MESELISLPIIEQTSSNFYPLLEATDAEQLPRTRLEKGEMPFIDVEGNLLIKKRDFTRYGKQVVGHLQIGAAYLASDLSENFLNITANDYETLREKVLKCGAGVMILTENLLQINQDSAVSLLNLITGIDPQVLSDSPMQHHLLNLSIASSREYVESVNEQTVFKPEATNHQGVISIDKLLYLWLSSESSLPDHKSIQFERHLISKILTIFEKGSPTDNQISQSNIERVFQLRRNSRNLRREFTGRRLP